MPLHHEFKINYSMIFRVVVGVNFIRTSLVLFLCILFWYYFVTGCLTSLNCSCFVFLISILFADWLFQTDDDPGNDVDVTVERTVDDELVFVDLFRCANNVWYVTCMNLCQNCLYNISNVYLIIF